MVAEGQRLKDLMRWSLGTYLENIQEGLYFPKLGVYDLNDDGNPDVLLIADKNDQGQYSELLEKYPITVYALSEGNIMLTQGDKGYIKPAGKDGVFKFETPKYYYTPISEQDILVNPNLVQNSFWK